MAKKKSIDDEVQEGSSLTSEIEPTILEGTLAKKGITSRKFKDEYGIDPSRIMRYKENPDGSKTFLCYEETSGGLSFYTIRASKKTKDWRQIVRDYEGE